MIEFQWIVVEPRDATVEVGTITGERDVRAGLPFLVLERAAEAERWRERTLVGGRESRPFNATDDANAESANTVLQLGCESCWSSLPSTIA